MIASFFLVEFVLSLSFPPSASNQDILAGAAAYTAALVVFIGFALNSSR